MTDYLSRLDAMPEADRWKQARSWLFEESLPFFKELRENRPVLVLPEVTLVTRHADCNAILRRHQTFGVDLYRPKQGDYLMSHDGDAIHWREKSVMKSILDIEAVPDIRKFVAVRTQEALDRADGRIEVVRTLSRGIPVQLVQYWFGFRGANPDKLIEWSYWNQQDAFWNQPFDSVWHPDQQAVIDARVKANYRMALYLARLCGGRYIADTFGSRANDPVTRLVELSRSGGLEFGFRNVIQNVGGLLIGAVETTNHVVVNALCHLFSDPDLTRGAIAAAQSDTPEDVDGWVYEALRYRPAFPYFFRTCHRDTVLSADTPHATTVKTGDTVLAVTHSAMFDPAGFPNPDSFDPGRDMSDTFTFGQGIHACLGRHVAGVMVPEIIRQILRRADITPAAPAIYKSMVPDQFDLTYSD